MSNDILDLVKEEVEKIIRHYKDLAADGLSLSEGWQLIQLATSSLVQVAERLQGVSGEQKKAAVMAALEELIDHVLAQWDIPWVPDMLERAVFDPMLKRIMMAFASGAVDAVVTLLNKTNGWLPPAPESPAEPGPDAPEAPATPSLPDNWEPY